MTNPIADRYEVLDTLGRGSFGRTLLARELGTEQKVAIKALHTDRADSLSRRMKPFFVEGRPAVGHIQKLDLSRSPLGDRVVRVTYEFEADGQIHRGGDQLMARITDRWREGDTVPVLYLADRDYDSIVVMT